MNKYIFASFNINKHLEIASQLNKIELISLQDVGYTTKIIESGITLDENAALKANVIYKNYNLPCISDDTGLEVYALDGNPGVFSARYAGDESNSCKNIQKLLINLKNIKDRRARFRTVICLKRRSEEKFFEGVVNGVITKEMLGKNGFGYDPIFKPDGYSQTFAEMSLQEKNKISHRSMAVQKLITYLNI